MRAQQVGSVPRGHPYPGPAAETHRSPPRVPGWRGSGSLDGSLCACSTIQCCCSPEPVFFLVTCSDFSQGQSTKLAGRNSGAPSGTAGPECRAQTQPPFAGRWLVLRARRGSLGAALESQEPSETPSSSWNFTGHSPKRPSGTLVLPVLLTSAVIVGLKSSLSW